MPIFEALAAACAPAVALDLLAGIAMAESGVRSLSVRDGVQSGLVGSSGEGVAVIVGAADQGRDLGIGLMGITASRLQKAGVSIADGFDPCVSMGAAQTLIKGMYAEAEKRGLDPQLWDRVAIRDWWRPDDRFVSGAAYEGAVRAERSKVDAISKISIHRTMHAAVVNAAISPNSTVGRAGNTHDAQALPRTSRVEALRGTVPTGPAPEPEKWDVFARAKTSGVVIFGK